MNFLAEFCCELAQSLLAAGDQRHAMPAGHQFACDVAPIPDEAPVTTAVEVGDGLGKGMPSNLQARRVATVGRMDGYCPKTVHRTHGR